MTNVIQSAAMAEKAISVRLDVEAQRALQFLMRGGLSQSEAIRAALLTASRSSRHDQMALDAKRLAADPEDRALVAEIRDFFDEL
jgi:Arc/MetJ-type ribon-helix-helix transcriptional regulator